MGPREWDIVFEIAPDAHDKAEPMSHLTALVRREDRTRR